MSEYLMGKGIPAKFKELGEGAPNLDAQTDDFLWEFWNFARHSTLLARQLFPGRSKGHVQALGHLAGYAANKATAMNCRRKGDIRAAQVYESICDEIYARLPGWARW